MVVFVGQGDSNYFAGGGRVSIFNLSVAEDPWEILEMWMDWILEMEILDLL